MKKNQALITLLTLIVFSGTLLAQGYAGDKATAEPTMLIDKPTAGMLKRGEYSINGFFFQRGGVLLGVSVGLLDVFNFGVSYGGTDIIGSKQVRMNPVPGVKAKLRLFDESTALPAIALGFDSQGKEPYLDSLSRYLVKSPGFFVAASKNYSFGGYLSFHGGLTYSNDGGDGDKDLNAFVGIEKSLGSIVSFLAEYDFGFNDDHYKALGRGRGYLNLGLRISAGKGFMLGVDLKDIIKNQRDVHFGNRVLTIDFLGSF